MSRTRVVHITIESYPTPEEAAEMVRQSIPQIRALLEADRDGRAHAGIVADRRSVRGSDDRRDLELVAAAEEVTR
jgi:hypothetical protein